MKTILYIFMILTIITSVIAINPVFMSYNYITPSTGSAGNISLGNTSFNIIMSLNESDPIYSSKRNELITNASNGQTAYSWGNHALSGYWTYNDSLVNMAIEGNTAYGWGDHHLESYLTSEDDPEVFEVTLNKWCVGTGTQVTCNQTNPISGITSYNDSAVVNALQGENTTIWNTIWEINQNTTNLNSSIELRTMTSTTNEAITNISTLQGQIVELTQNDTTLNTSIELRTMTVTTNEAITNISTLQGQIVELNQNDSTLNTSIELRTMTVTTNEAITNISTLQGQIVELNQNDTALNATIELRAPLASPSFTGNILINGGYGAGGISLTSNGSALIYDDLLLGGDLLSVGTTILNGTFLPSASYIYNLGAESQGWNYIYSNYLYAVYGVVAENIYANTTIYTDGDIFTQGAGDDLWLGTNTQASANLRAYANGTLRASEIITAGKNVCVTGGNCLSTITSYNDSLVVNSLQGENTTIWSNLNNLNSSIELRTMTVTTNEAISNISTLQGQIVELNQNDTSLNATIELRAPSASPSFTGTVTTAGAINQTLSMSSSATFVTHIDFGNVSLVTNITHFCLKGKSTICVET